MDVNVLCTHRESFGLALIEAMSVNTPVVATRVGGIPEIVEDGVTGLLHDEGDSLGLANAIRRVATDIALRDRLVRCAADSIRTKFVKETTVKQVVALYQTLM